MAEAAPTLEARLVAQLTDIFPDIEERIIRDNVNSLLLATNFPAPDEYFLYRCVEALLTPADQPETGAVGTKRVKIADSPEDIKRARRVGGNGDGGSSFADDSIQLSEEEAAGPQIDPVEFAKQAGMKSIIELFPWIDPAWVSQQFGKPNVNVETLADLILANQSAIPKKLKPKSVQVASSVAAASASGATTSTGGFSTAKAPQPVVKSVSTGRPREAVVLDQESSAKAGEGADSILERAREPGDVFECEICYDEKLISEQMVTCANQHKFCSECLREYGREAIYGQGKSDLLCMNDECDARFPQEMLVKALDAESLKKLEEKRMVESINSAEIEGLEKCLYCNYAASFDVPPEVNKVFLCGDPNCERQYCRICHVDWEEHFGKPCKEVETQDDTRKRREAEEQMAAAVIRKCNKCKAPLIKEEGCNKLVCSCGAIMCYLCRQSIEKEKYDHFCRHLRDPRCQGCSLCNKCNLFEDPKVKNDAAVKRIQTEATKALAESGKILKIGAADSAPRPQPAAAVDVGYPQILMPVMAGMQRQVQQLAAAVAQVAPGHPAGNLVGVQFQQNLPAQVVNQNAQQYGPHGGARPRDPMPPMPMFRQIARRQQARHGIGYVVTPATRPQLRMDARLAPDGGYRPRVDYDLPAQFPPPFPPNPPQDD